MARRNQHWRKHSGSGRRLIRLLYKGLASGAVTSSAQYLRKRAVPASRNTGLPLRRPETKKKPRKKHKKTPTPTPNKLVINMNRR
jgi:hypothetical protein